MKSIAGLSMTAISLTQPCPQLVSYEEYVPLAESSELDLELHFGRVVTRQWAGIRHVERRHRIQDLMEGALGPAWEVLAGMPFRALPQYEGRNADVGVVSVERWKEALKLDYLARSPEIVIDSHGYHGIRRNCLRGHRLRPPRHRRCLPPG